MSQSGSDRRLITLEGQGNFRDLGGYASADGRRVKWQHLYRSGELHALSDSDIEKLTELRIRTVIDLRAEKEAERNGADRLPSGASLVTISIDPGDLSPIVGPAFATGDFSGIPADLLHQINRDYVRSWHKELGALIRLAAEPENRPLVFHCTQGKDRAGISAAILLSALGVPWESVMEDYLLSNVQRHEHASEGLNTLRKSAARRRKVSAGDVDMTNIRGIFFVDAAYLGAAHDEIQERYGSVESFIREGVGCSDSELERLRDSLLE